MRVGMIGMGKLGLPVALTISGCGHKVFAYDIRDAPRWFLEDRNIPYQEEGIQPLLDAHDVGWCDTVEEVVDNCEIVFISVQTPHGPEHEGSTRIPDTRADFDYTYLKSAVREVAEACADLHQPTTVAVISTCLPGTYRREIKPLLNEYTRYVYTPQFIAMGTVVRDYLHPEFNLIGVEDPEAADQLDWFYGSINAAPTVRTDITTAEGAKVAYNTVITAKTVLANAWGEMSARIGMDFDAIYRTWELADRRLLSEKYLDAGMSDGGGCHPRDNIALSWLADEIGMSHNIWDDLMAAREDYEEWHAELAVNTARAHKLPLVILGKAFKPETNIQTGSAAVLMKNLADEKSEDVIHADHIQEPPVAVYFIATKNQEYKAYTFPKGSVVLDPFGYIEDRSGVLVYRIGRR